MTTSTKDQRCLQYKQALVKVKNKNKTQQPASYFSFGTSPQAYQETTGENELLVQQLSGADGRPENI